ncbi:MAG: metallophosphoesterase [Candidatus Susulua stagnicola]|nr:metallophosphoesterase [Candidatus Susulua stagnicola]
MKILVLSDTHIPVTASKLPEIIEKEAKACDCCLHCGDYIIYPVYEVLSQWAKIYGVCGNMDEDTIKNNLPAKQILKFEEITLAITHGAGHPKKILEHINREFASEAKDIDIFVFGHSHMPLNEEINGKIYFNPGSPTDTIFAPYQSYGILEINGKEIKRSIVKIG